MIMVVRKRLSLIVVALVMIFGGLMPVKAASVTKTVGGKTITATGMTNSGATQTTITKGRYELNDWGVGLKIPSETFKDRWYNYYTDDNGYSSSYVYCLDSLKKGPGTVYAGRFFFYDQNTLEKLDPKDFVYAYDVAAMTILKSGSKNALDKSLALRSLTATFGFLLNDSAYSNTAANNYPVYQYRAFYGMAAKWKSENSEIQGYIDTIKSNTEGGSKIGASLSGFSNYYWVAIDTDVALGQSIIDSAKSLYIAGLAAAAEHVSKASSDASVDPDNGIVGDLQEVEDANGILVYKDVDYKITLSGVNTSYEDLSFMLTSLTFEGGAGTYGALTEPQIVEIKINGKQFCGGYEDVYGTAHNDCEIHVGTTNLIKPGDGFVQDGENVIEIKIRVQGYKTVKEGANVPKLNCDKNNMKFKLEYEYNLGDGARSELEKYVGIVWRPVADLASYQRYVSYIGEATPDGSEDSKGTPGSIEGKVVLIEECDCDLLAEACEQSGNIASDDCKLFQETCEECDVLEVFCKITGSGSQYCKKYEEQNCEDKPSESNCNTQIIPVTECCAGAEMEIDPAFVFTGMMSEDYEIHGVIENDIKVCFVDKVDDGDTVVDDVGNSYQMLTDDRVSSNRYCKVNCREDYSITFPTAKRVNAGRYFTFQVKISEGKKQCFTNTINKKLFEADMLAAEKAIVDATNDYLYWKAAYENRTDYKYNQGTECPSGCSCNEFDNAVYIQVGGVDAWTYPQFKDQYYSFNEQISQPTTQNVYEEKGTIGVHKTGTASCYVGTNWRGDDIYVDRDMTEQNDSPTISQLEKELKAYIESQWASRVGGVKIEAAVKHYENLIKEYNNCGLWEAEYNYDPEVKYTYDEVYAARAGMPTKMLTDSIDPGSPSYQYCLQQEPGEGPKITDQKYTQCTTGFVSSYQMLDDNYTVCRLEGETAVCERDEQSRHLVTPVRYKKYEQKANSSYIPDTLFWNIYPSGEIAYSAQSDAVELTNKLPVSLGTQKGVYKYNINVTNLGEFYNSGSTGRFVGGGAGTPVIGDNIDFTCAYLVNIPESSMVCDFSGCQGPDCVSNCVGPGCSDDFLCEGENCVSDCVGIGCIYDKDSGTSLLQKQVSLSNLFPNGTDSYNWTNNKGVTTMGEIEGKGNSVYDETPLLSITINPSVSREIRNYNASVERDGGYSNKTVTCQDFGGYEKIACYSSFMDELLAGRVNGVNVGNIVNSNSLINSIRYTNSYFTLWGAGGISEEAMIGPSWK